MVQASFFVGISSGYGSRRVDTLAVDNGEVSIFVGIVSIYQCKAVDETTLLMSIMAMASHG
jgi:hypothetical protein